MHFQLCYLYKIWSGKRGSNPRPRRWQRLALPLSYSRILDHHGGIQPPSPISTIGVLHALHQ